MSLAVARTVKPSSLIHLSRVLRPLSALVLLLAALGAGCSSKRTSGAPPVSAPIAERPALVDQRRDAPLSAPQTVVQLPPPQEIPAGAAPARRPSPPTEPTGPAESAAAARRPVPTPPPTTASGPPDSRAEEQQASSAGLPQLTPMLSPAERRAMESELDRRLVQTRANLSKLNGRKLSGEQVAAVKRIQAFLTQAEEAREQDLNLAGNLAQRAQVLADDLVRSAM